MQYNIELHRRLYLVKVVKKCEIVFVVLFQTGRDLFQTGREVRRDALARGHRA